MIRKDNRSVGISLQFNGCRPEKHQDNLQTVMAYNYEVKRANELARSNTMNLALSKVATLLESSSNSELILDTLGAE